MTDGLGGIRPRARPVQEAEDQAPSAAPAESLRPVPRPRPESPSRQGAAEPTGLPAEPSASPAPDAAGASELAVARSLVPRARPTGVSLAAGVDAPRGASPGTFAPPRLGVDFTVPGASLARPDLTRNVVWQDAVVDIPLVPGRRLSDDVVVGQFRDGSAPHLIVSVAAQGEHWLTNGERLERGRVHQPADVEALRSSGTTLAYFTDGEGRRVDMPLPHGARLRQIYANAHGEIVPDADLNVLFFDLASDRDFPLTEALTGQSRINRRDLNSLVGRMLECTPVPGQIELWQGRRVTVDGDGVETATIAGPRAPADTCWRTAPVEPGAPNPADAIDVSGITLRQVRGVLRPGELQLGPDVELDVVRGRVETSGPIGDTTTHLDVEFRSLLAESEGTLLDTGPGAARLTLRTTFPRGPDGEYDLEEAPAISVTMRELETSDLELTVPGIEDGEVSEYGLHARNVRLDAGSTVNLGSIGAETSLELGFRFDSMAIEAADRAPNAAPLTRFTAGAGHLRARVDADGRTIALDALRVEDMSLRVPGLESEPGSREPAALSLDEFELGPNSSIGLGTHGPRLDLRSMEVVDFVGRAEIPGRGSLTLGSEAHPAAFRDVSLYYAPGAPAEPGESSNDRFALSFSSADVDAAVEAVHLPRSDRLGLQLGEGRLSGHFGGRFDYFPPNGGRPARQRIELTPVESPLTFNGAMPELFINTDRFTAQGRDMRGTARIESLVLDSEEESAGLAGLHVDVEGETDLVRITGTTQEPILVEQGRLSLAVDADVLEENRAPVLDARFNLAVAGSTGDNAQNVDALGDDAPIYFRVEPGERGGNWRLSGQASIDANGAARVRLDAGGEMEIGVEAGSNSRLSFDSLRGRIDESVRVLGRVAQERAPSVDAEALSRELEVARAVLNAHPELEAEYEGLIAREAAAAGERHPAPGARFGEADARRLREIEREHLRPLLQDVREVEAALARVGLGEGVAMRSEPLPVSVRAPEPLPPLRTFSAASLQGQSPIVLDLEHADDMLQSGYAELEVPLDANALSARLSGADLGPAVGEDYRLNIHELNMPDTTLRVGVQLGRNGEGDAVEAIGAVVPDVTRLHLDDPVTLGLTIENQPTPIGRKDVHAEIEFHGAVVRRGDDGQLYLHPQMQFHEFDLDTFIPLPDRRLRPSEEELGRQLTAALFPEGMPETLDGLLELSERAPLLMGGASAAEARFAERAARPAVPRSFTEIAAGGRPDEPRPFAASEYVDPLLAERLPGGATRALLDEVLNSFELDRAALRVGEHGALELSPERLPLGNGQFIDLGPDARLELDASVDGGLTIRGAQVPIEALRLGQRADEAGPGDDFQIEVGGAAGEVPVRLDLNLQVWPPPAGQSPVHRIRLGDIQGRIDRLRLATRDGELELDDVELGGGGNNAVILELGGSEPARAHAAMADISRADFSYVGTRVLPEHHDTPVDVRGQIEAGALMLADGRLRSGRLVEGVHPGTARFEPRALDIRGGMWRSGPMTIEDPGGRPAAELEQIELTGDLRVLLGDGRFNLRTVPGAQPNRFRMELGTFDASIRPTVDFTFGSGYASGRGLELDLQPGHGVTLSASDLDVRGLTERVAHFVLNGEEGRRVAVEPGTFVQVRDARFAYFMPEPSAAGRAEAELVVDGRYSIDVQRYALVEEAGYRDGPLRFDSRGQFAGGAYVEGWFDYEDRAEREADWRARVVVHLMTSEDQSFFELTGEGFTHEALRELASPASGR